MTERKRRGGPKPGYHLSKPRATAENFPETEMVPEYVTGNAQRGAWKKGWVAAEKGERITANPYDVTQTNYVRGLHGMWASGWRAYAGSGRAPKSK
jgi:hypothetical protein